MDASAPRCLLAAALITLGAPTVQAATGGEPCELPGAQLDPLANRAALLAQYEQLPHACLQAIFHSCNAESSENLMDFGSAAVCSFGYEAWLRQGFGGNFRALLAWWREQSSSVGEAGR